MTPLCINLFCGLGGWAEGFLAEGYDVVGFDIERHVYGEHRYPAQIVLQDVLTLHGSQFRDAAVIVASPPCQAYSYRAMPWKRAKALPPPDNALFDACFRIQREASDAAGRHIPLIVENVKGAQPWVGSARWHYGSFYLWGDVPALMPITRAAVKVPALNWSGSDKPGYKAEAFNSTAEKRIKNNGGSWFAQAHNTGSGHGQNPVNGRKGHGGGWFSDEREDGTRPDYRETGCITRRFNSRSAARKAASAMIAKIPFPLAQHIARVFKPDTFYAEARNGCATIGKARP
jgi:hypothetical protein